MDMLRRLINYRIIIIIIIIIRSGTSRVNLNRSSFVELGRGIWVIGTVELI